MINSNEKPKYKHIYYHELNRVCLRINRFAPVSMLQGHRIAISLIFCTELGPNQPHGLTDFNQDSNSFGFYLCAGGAGQMISPEVITLYPGSFVICPPDKHFKLMATSAGMLLFYMFFTISPVINSRIQFPRGILSQMLDELILITEEYRQNLPGWPERAGMRCSILLSRACILFGNFKSPSNSPYQTQFLDENVDRYLLSNIAMSIRLPEIADYFGVSMRTIIRHYQQMKGKSIHDRMQELRMELACTLLSKTLLSLIDVAAQVGFNNVNYFGKVFKKQIGVCPGEFRNKAFEKKIL